MSEIKTVQVIYGYLHQKVSRRIAERFIQAHAATVGLEVPQSPIARFWCRPAPPDSPARWIVGWTGPVVVRPTPTGPVSRPGSIILAT